MSDGLLISALPLVSRQQKPSDHSGHSGGLEFEWLSVDLRFIRHRWNDSKWSQPRPESLNNIVGLLRQMFESVLDWPVLTIFCGGLGFPIRRKSVFYLNKSFIK